MTVVSSRTLRALGALFALTLALVACGGDDDGTEAGDESAGAETPDTIRIGTFLSAVDYAPFYVARDQGFFEDAAGSSDVEYIEFDSAPAITEALGTGQIDMVFMAEPPALIAASGGIDVRIAALGASLTQDIIVPTDSEITSAADLAGARVAVLAGTSSHYGLLKIAEDAGVDPSDVEIVDMAPPDAQTAFAAGDVDAWAVWPPFVQQEIVNGTGELLPEGDAAIQSIAVVRADFASDYPAVYDELIGAIDDAKSYIAGNEEPAQAIVSDQVRVDPEVVALSWPRHDFTAVLDEGIVEDIQAKADFLHDNEFLDNAVDVSALVDLEQ
jgi:sulfonate transport system substrate-binding protein